MGNTYYCDPGASGDNDGTTWEHAWETLQRAVDGTDGTQPVAGDIVYCKGTESLSAAVDFDGNSGTYDGGYIKYIGVNDACTNEPPEASDYGDYFTLDGQENNINGITFNDSDYIWLENIKMFECDGTAGLDTANAYSDHCVFVNLWADQCDAVGLKIQAYFRYATVVRCRASNNTDDGVECTSANAVVLGCVAYSNGARGLVCASCKVVGCVSYDNTGYGMYFYGMTLVMNNVADNNTSDGIYDNYASCVSVLAGCRITNNSETGKHGLMNNVNHRVKLFGCYFGGNDDDISGYYDDVTIDGVSILTLAGSDTNHGYTTAGSDFNLRSDATLRSQAIELP